MSTSSSDIVIVSAARTPIGSFSGAFATVEAHELGKTAIEAALARAGVAGEEVSELIFGQVLTAGKGQNPARQASRAAGISDAAPAWLVNQVCGSGLRTVALAAQQIMTGSADIVVAGGQESMSLSAHAAYMRAGTKMGDLGLVDTMIRDGLTDAFFSYHMGITAENVAEKWQITREEQDQFATASQNKAEAAQAAGRFDAEIAAVTVKGRKGDVTVAKNYLDAAEIAELNRIVVMFLDFAEDQARRRKQVFLRDWTTRLDDFLRFNDRAVLPNAGRVTRADADRKAAEEYDAFSARRRTELEADGERDAMRQLEEAAKSLPEIRPVTRSERGES